MVPLHVWKQRQELHYKVRDFFLKRNLVEVDVPLLSAASGTDPHIDYYETLEPARYLATSPEFFMKRLLACGFGDCFSLTHAFRKGESGVRHNSEFNIAEWYRVGFSAQDLQREIVDLVNDILKLNLSIKRTAWRSLFEDADIEAIIKEHSEWSREDAEDYFISNAIEGSLGAGCAEFIIDYPVERAALAKTTVDSAGHEVACRFELFVNGVELCNGYSELTDTSEQKQRFLKDIQKRKQMGKSVPRIDENFLAALESMPACSGVALGLDRLYMLALGKTDIREVLLFSDSDS